MKVEQTRDDMDREEYVLTFEGDEVRTREVDGHEYTPTRATVVLVETEDGPWEDLDVALRGRDARGFETIEHVARWDNLPAEVRAWLNATLQDRNDNR